MQAEMKREGFELDKIADMFSGEAAIALNAGLSARGKKQPRLLIALKIKNAAENCKLKFIHTIQKEKWICMKFSN